MAKQFETHYVSWRQAKDRPNQLFANEAGYGAAAASALESKLNALAEDGWIIDQIIPATGIDPKHTAAFTIVAFK